MNFLLSSTCLWHNHKIGRGLGGPKNDHYRLSVQMLDCEGTRLQERENKIARQLSATFSLLKRSQGA